MPGKLSRQDRLQRDKERDITAWLNGYLAAVRRIEEAGQKALGQKLRLEAEKLQSGRRPE
jgi:hypothetical protein